ncbi:hypothetical protein KC354_g74 [Hortaea werneckii]|nr:hypothetical protein KC354_g74 [Hortaea werneckii]
MQVRKVLSQEALNRPNVSTRSLRSWAAFQQIHLRYAFVSPIAELLATFEHIPKKSNQSANVPVKDVEKSELSTRATNTVTPASSPALEGLKSSKPVRLAFEGVNWSRYGCPGGETT